MNWTLGSVECGKRSIWRLLLDLRQRERPERRADAQPHPPPSPPPINLITAYKNHSMKFWMCLRKSTYLLPEGTVSLGQGNRKHFKTYLLPDLFHRRKEGKMSMGNWMLILETYHDKIQNRVCWSLVRDGPTGWDLLGDYSEDRVPLTCLQRA